MDGNRSGGMFCIVDFAKGRKRTVVPDTWLSINDTLCLLPPDATDNDVEVMVRNLAEPGEGWQMHEVSSLMTFDSYSEAKKQLQRSNRGPSQSKSSCQRKRKRPPYLEDYSTRDSDDDRKPYTVFGVDYDDEAASENEWIPPPELNLRIENVNTAKKTIQNDQRPISRRINQSRLSSRKENIDVTCDCQSTCHAAFLQALNGMQKQLDRNQQMMQQLLGGQRQLKRVLRSQPVNQANVPEEMDAISEDSTHFMQCRMEGIKKVVAELLPSSAKCLLSAIITRIEEKGVEEVEDLKYLNFEEDLKGILEEVPARKLKEKIDSFFNGGESSESANEPNTSACKGPALSPISSASHSLDWPEKFRIPVEKMPKTIINKLEKNKRLIPSEYRKFIRIIIAAVLDIHKKPLKRHLSIIAKNVTDMFPIMREILDDKVVGTGYDGLLRKMISRVENHSRLNPETKEIKMVERKAVKKMYGCINFYPKQDDMFENENKKAALLQEYQLLSWNVDIVDQLMKETFALQRKEILEIQSIEKIKRKWPFLFIGRFSFCHFKYLMDIDLVIKMNNAISKKIPELYEFLRSEGSVATDPSRYLEALTGYFSEDSTSIIRIFEANSIKEVVRNESTPASPYIAAFGDPFKGDACCVLFIERLQASEFISLKVASALWFASFYIFGLDYPEECSATAEFIQRSFIGINPETGTKSRKRPRRSNVNSKVLSLIEKLCNFKSMWSM